MKKVTIQTSVLAGLMVLAALFMTSCGKDNSVVPEEKISNPEFALYNSLRVYYDNGGDDYGCSGSGGNCLPDVVVTGLAQHAFDDFFDATGSGNVDEVKQVVEQHYYTYAEVIKETYLKAVLQDKLFVKSKTGDQEARYLRFVRASGKDVAVYPIIKK